MPDLEESDEVSLSSLLQSQHGAGLEPQVRLEVLGNLTDQPLERQLADEQLRRLLVLANLAQSDRAGPVAVGLLDATGGRRGFASSLRRQLLARSLRAEQKPSTCSNGCSVHGDRLRKAPVPRCSLRARAFRRTLPPVDLRAVCLVRAMLRRKREDALQRRLTPRVLDAAALSPIGRRGEC